MQSMGKPSDSYQRGHHGISSKETKHNKTDKTANQLTQLMEDFFRTADD
jgi:hypothetical protein